MAILRVGVSASKVTLRVYQIFISMFTTEVELTLKIAKVFIIVRVIAHLV